MFIALCAWLPCFVFFHETHHMGEFQLLVCSLYCFILFCLDQVIWSVRPDDGQSAIPLR